VKAVLAAADLTARDTILAGHLDRMREQLRQTEAAVDSLRRMLEGGAAAIAIEERVLEGGPTISAAADLVAQGRLLVVVGRLRPAAGDRRGGRT